MKNTIIAFATTILGVVLIALNNVRADDQKTNTAIPAAESAQNDIAIPAKESFHIYLLMGQSNMVGRDTRALASELKSSRVLALNPDGHWVVAKDPIHAQDGRIEPGIGPGMSFAFKMLGTDPKITIGLIPCAVGGSPLRRWVKGADLYEKAMSRAKESTKVGVIKGVLWHQGEADTTKQQNAESYETRLTQMFKDLRADLGKPELPIVVGQLGQFLSNSPEKYPYVDTVRLAIKHLPEALPYVGYADSAALSDKGDKLHFSGEAQREFGVRYANAMLEIQKSSTAKHD